MSEEPHPPARGLRTPDNLRPQKQGTVEASARVAKSADAKDLKSFSRQRECGFKSRPGHQQPSRYCPASPLTDNRRAWWAFSVSHSFFSNSNRTDRSSCAV